MENGVHSIESTTVIKYIQLPFVFDSIKMQDEVNALANNYWKTHYQKRDFEGGWTVLPLRSINGNPQLIHAIPQSSSDNIPQYRDTELLEKCPYLKDVLLHLRCDKNLVRLMKLNAGSIIKKHKDLELNFESGEARIHIPVQTNPQVEFFIMDERIVMNEGECWYLNFNLEHNVNNFGTTDRIHLVVDCIVNDWMRESFTENVLKRKDVSSAEIKMYQQKKTEIIPVTKIPTSPVNKELNKAKASSAEFKKCVSFLNDIGINTTFGKIEGSSFLAGLAIKDGKIIIDEEALQFPGDILHEAGHIAVVPANERHTLNETLIELREQREAEEMMAIAWSYAACIYLEIDPLFVFHDAGYNGGGSNIAENFKNKRYFGVPMLQWTGLTYDDKNAKEMNVPAYPHMIKWTRD